jgi:PKD repeat protein
MRTRSWIPIIGLLACFSAAGLRAQSSSPPGVESVTGVADVQVEDDFDSGSAVTVYRLRTTDGGSVPLRFEKPPSIELRTGDPIRVYGRRTADEIVVDQVERDGASMTSSTWTTGPKRVLLTLLNWKDDTSQPYTIAQATATMFGATNSVAAFFKENSLNATTMSGDVAGWYTATVNKPTTCDISAVQTQSEAAAVAHGYVLANYDFKVYVFNHLPCGWSGLAAVGAPGAWINQAHSVYVTGHELVHNYGVLHSHSYNCSPNVIGGTCSRSEYGDPFDIMGSGTRHFAGWSKNYFGWMTPSEVYTVPLGASGNYTLSPAELRGGVRGLAITTDAGRTYWLEYRKSTGFDTGIPSTAQHGALVRIAPSPVSGVDLLDTTPNGNFSDSALVVGASMTDAAASMKITTMAESGGNLDVNILFGVTPPTAAFTFLPATPKLGQAVTFTNTSSGFPTTFLWDFGDGQTSTAKNPTHNFSGTGTFTVKLTSSNAMGGSSTTKPVPVAAGTPLKFYGVTPCRILDTRTPAGGGAIAANTTRYVIVATKCGIPTTAVAVAINATVTLPTSTGDISFFAGTATVDFKANQTRSNNAVLPLTNTYYLMPKAEMPSGSVHLIIDVSGYTQ